MNMDVTDNDKRIITDAVLAYFTGWVRRHGKHDAINMLQELARNDRAAVLSFDDVRLVLKCLKAYDQDTTELETRIEEALNEALGR